MTPPPVSLRPVVEADEALLLDWTNDPATRAASRSADPIEPREHHRWLIERLADAAGARMWIGRAGDESIGVVRFERRAPDRVEVSITVAPRARGRGLAGPLLEAGLSAARGAFGSVRIVAAIKPVNAASLAVFARAGFAPITDQAVVDPDRPNLVWLERR